MWVFDGETWIDEGSGVCKAEITEHRPLFNVEMPELRVEEVTRPREEPSRTPAAKPELSH